MASSARSTIGRPRWIAAAALALGLSLTAPAPAWSAEPEPEDWPCVQRLVPELSAGIVWTGPPVDEVAATWREDDAVEELAHKLVARRTPMEEANEAIAAFAQGLGADKDRKLTMLFAGALELINADRRQILDGIRRAARRQNALADSIEAKTAELNQLPTDGTPAQEERREALEEQLLWDSRIFDERQQSMKYVCETPVLLEQRLFALGREIQTHLD